VSFITPGIPVLFVPDYSTDELFDRGVDLARAKLLVKPFDHVKLIQFVRNLLDEQPRVKQRFSVEANGTDVSCEVNRKFGIETMTEPTRI
jgi:DNA-binding response OmpR family regulator